MKLALLSLGTLLAASGLAQTTPNQTGWYAYHLSKVPTTAFGENSTSGARLKPSTSLPTVYAYDSLWTKRGFLTTTVYNKEGKISNAALTEKFRPTPKALTRFRLATISKYVGPLMAVSGLAISYIGLNGNTYTRTVKAVVSPQNPNAPAEIQVIYTERSLPKVLAGLGVFAGGLYLIETSSELTSKAVTLFNTSVVHRGLTSHLKTVKLGVTTTGLVMLEARF